MNDSTILRIKVPAHLYESVKEQLTLKEAKQNFGMPGATTVKEKKSSSDESKPKKKSEPKGEKKAKAPENKAPKESTPKTEKKKSPNIPKDGMNKVDSKKLKISELKKMYEIIGAKLQEMEGGKVDETDRAARRGYQSTRLSHLGTQDYDDPQPTTDSLRAGLNDLQKKVDELAAQLEDMKATGAAPEEMEAIQKELDYTKSRWDATFDGLHKSIFGR